MPPQPNKEKFQRLTNFERGRIINLQEGGFSYRAIGACVQRNSSTVMRVWKQRTDEHRTTRKTGSGRRKWPNTRSYGLGAVSYHGRSNLLRIEGNLNSNTYVHEVLQPEVIPFLQGILGAIFQQDNARPHVAKTVRDFFSVQHMQLLPWAAYSPDMSLIEHVWDLVDRCLAREPRPAASKDEHLLRIQAILNSLPQTDIQNLFNSLPRRIAAFIAAYGGYTKY
ncbi:transposable element Tcb2 transposase [Trichonephila clavipes]|uniref:Transposable element Tcb2 transposase n=1 Tax=Trichonephila clavipes TaxID=2585209 RepID=A0A8X6URU6_TRICX|nr:transposable element Tcb2 transposase [Trichonephila clavipes]